MMSRRNGNSQNFQSRQNGSRRNGSMRNGTNQGETGVGEMGVIRINSQARAKAIDRNMHRCQGVQANGAFAIKYLSL